MDLAQLSASTGVNYTECLDDPINLPSDFDGHAYPGLVALLVACGFYWVVLSRYYKSVAPNSTYRFDGRLATRLHVPGLPRVTVGVAGLFALVGIWTGTIIELLFVYKKTLLEAFVSVLTDPHSPITYSSLVFSIVSAMESRKSLKVPENASQLAFAFLWGTMASIGYGHLVARCPYDVQLHTITLFLPSLVAATCIGAQLLMPSSFLLAAGACFGMAMTGLGLVMIGVVGFKFRHHSWWMQMSTGHKMRKIPLFFFDICALVFVLFVLAFYLFGRFRGKRLGIDNPEYTVKNSVVDDDYGDVELGRSEELKALLKNVHV